MGCPNTTFMREMDYSSLLYHSIAQYIVVIRWRAGCFQDFDQHIVYIWKHLVISQVAENAYPIFDYCIFSRTQLHIDSDVVVMHKVANGLHSFITLFCRNR